jgi:hypothetical protein
MNLIHESISPRKRLYEDSDNPPAENVIESEIEVFCLSRNDTLN